MDEVKTGMSVRALEDRPIGAVIGVHGCCFEFEQHGGAGQVSITKDGVFHTHSGVVTLICGEQQLNRYACLIHPSRKPAKIEPQRSSQTYRRPTRVAARPSVIRH